MKKINSKKRVLTGIWMACIYIPFVALGGYFFYALSLLLAYVGTRELIKMHNTKNGLNKQIAYILPVFSVLLVTVVMLSDLQIKTFDSSFVLLCLLVIFASLLVLPLFYKEISMKDSFFYIGSILYGGLSFGLIAVMRNVQLPSSHNLVLGPIDFNVTGVALFCFVLFSSMFTDIGAYEIGCRFGKRKLIPDVSPNKTIEGSVGGTIVGSLVGTIELVACEYLLGFNLYRISNVFLNVLCIFLTAILLSLVGQVGDLIASKLKREYEIKDYGTCFPGHGGVMDRFDSFILTTIVFTIILALSGVILC